MEATEWKEFKTDQGDPYYYCVRTGQSQWERPLALGPDDTPISWELLADGVWMRVHLSDGYIYYYNKETKQSTWDSPTAVTSSTAPLIRATSEQEFLRSDEGSALVQSKPSLNSIKRKLSDTLPSESNENEDETGTSTKRLKTDDVESKKVEDMTVTPHAHSENVPPPPAGTIPSDEGEYEKSVVAFKEMLREKKLTPFSSWEKELPKLCYDPRFKLLPKHSERKAVFESYVKNLMHEDRHSKLEKAKNLAAALQNVAAKYAAELGGSLSFSEFRRITADAEVWKANSDSKELRTLYYHHIAPMLKEEQEQKRKQKERLQNDFLQLLRETKSVSPESVWSETENLLVRDPRYEAIPAAQRERLFNRHIQSLSSGYSRKQRRLREEASFREREKEVRAKREREQREMGEHRRLLHDDTARQQFNTLLTEKIKDHTMHWREGRDLLRGDKRYSESKLSSEEKENLFRKHLQKLLDGIHDAYRALLQETDQIEFVTPWSVARKLLSKDPRYQRMPTEHDKESIYESHIHQLHVTAKQEFLELLADTKVITASTLTSGPLFEKVENLLRGDKRYKRFDCNPSERHSLLEGYIASLKSKRDREEQAD